MARYSLKIGILILIIMAFSVEAVLAFSVNQEIQLGKEVSLEVEKEMPLSKNEKWQKDVAEMGARFVPHVKRKEIPYKFHIIDAKDQINAFALPGGYVYFTERMWKIMTPDERAAVMAHEVTHCDQRHAIDGMIKSQQRALWTLPLMVLGGGWGYAVAIGNTMINQRYSRKMEREADELGIQLCKQAGYNPAGSVTSMKKLLSIEGGVNRYEISDIFASHPDTLKRITYLSQEAIAMGASLSDLELKAVDDPARLGNISKTSSDMGILYARVSTPLEYGQKVLIKKMLWDDDLQALAPKTIATATVLTPGKLPTLLVDKADGTNFGDIMEGDGIFPIPAPATDGTISPTLKEPVKS